MQSRSSRLDALLSTTLINVLGVRLLAIINNIGVAAEILGMVVLRADPAVLRQQPVARSAVRHVVDGPGSQNGNYFAVFLVGMFMALFVVYGFDTAGTFGEETVDAGRQAPRGVLSSIWSERHRRRDLPAGGHAVVQGHRRGHRRRPGLRLPDRDDDQGEPDLRRSAASRSARSTSSSSCIAVYVCTLAIQGATDPADVLDGPRRQPAARWSCGATSTRRFQTPANAAVAVGVLAAIPFLVIGRGDRRIYIAIAATGMIYICVLPVQPRRARRPPEGLAAPGGVVQPR